VNVEKIIKTEISLSLQSRTIIHLSLVQNKINEAIHAALKPFDVSLQQFNVLRILRGQKGKPANLSTINQRMVSKMSNTSRLVDKLIAKGFVDRITCENNRRKVEISITEKGLVSLFEMDRVLLKTEGEILAGFSDPKLIAINELLDQF
jgi:MarR family 2-MHQ and catechol resistance regulon transcriptional repressor